MLKRMTLVVCVIALGLAPARAQREKPAVVVHAFAVPSGVTWPYDVNQLQIQTVSAVQAQDGNLFDAAVEAPEHRGRVYVLDGEVLEWHKGNTVERMALALGSVAGRENAKIHFWLTDPDGKRVFERTEVIRQEFMKNAHEKSVGLLAKPFADKIAETLKEAQLAPAP